jgi:hypothetical protein
MLQKEDKVSGGLGTGTYMAIAYMESPFHSYGPNLLRLPNPRLPNSIKQSLNLLVPIQGKQFVFIFNILFSLSTPQTTRCRQPFFTTCVRSKLICERLDGDRIM